MNGKNISKLISLLFIILTMLFSCDTTTTTDKNAESGNQSTTDTNKPADKEPVDDDKPVVENPSDKEPVEDDKPVVENTLDYNSYPEDCSIIVSNMSNERLVLFKNELFESNIIGAIGKYEQNHYLKKDKKLFSKTESFRLIAIKEEDYLKNKEDLYKTLTNNPFARIYAFYNATGTNETVYKISADLGGDYKLIVQNTTTFNVELRKNSIDGEVIGYVGRQTADTTFNLNEGKYTLFPVFIKYHSMLDCIFEVIPTFPETSLNEQLRGFPKFDFFELGDGESINKDHTFIAADFKDSEYSLITGSAFITVINESGVSVQLKKGSSVVKTNTGSGETIASGKSYTYQIRFPQRPDLSYPKEYEVSKGVYKLGTSLAYVDISGFNFASDTIYELRVTGKDAANLVVGEFSNPTVVDWDAMPNN